MRISRKCENCGLMRITISWSGLRNHEECKQRGKLIREKKKSPTQDIRHFFHGTVIDRVMREWLENDPYNNRGAMPLMVNEIFDREIQTAKDTGDGIVRWKSRDDEAKLREWCVKAVTKLEPLLEEKVLPYEYMSATRFYVPMKLKMPRGNFITVWLAGEYDIATRDGNGQFHCWDLKGTEDESYWRKNIGQIVLYDLAMWAMYGQPTVDGGIIQPMCKTQIRPFEVTENDRAVLLGRIQRMAIDILEDNMPTDGFNTYCFRCPVKHACPAWSPVNGEMQLLEAGRVADANALKLTLLGGTDG